MLTAVHNFAEVLSTFEMKIRISFKEYMVSLPIYSGLHHTVLYILQTTNSGSFQRVKKGLVQKGMNTDVSAGSKQGLMLVCEKGNLIFQRGTMQNDVPDNGKLGSCIKSYRVET